MNKLTFSLLLVGLFAVAALARTSPQIRRPFRFTPGQTYVYEYRGRQWNGIAKLADQYAGITLDCDVILQALPEQSGKEVLMKLDDIKVEQLHTQALDNSDIRKLNPGKEQNDRQMNLYKEELSKPIRFVYQDGKIVHFVAETSDAEWSINIKKSILSLFQLDLAPTKIIKSSKRQLAEQVYGYNSEDVILQTREMPLVYPIYEESFGGICESQYEIDSVDNVEHRDQQDQMEFNDVLNVTKTVNYKNCLTDPSVSYDRHSFHIANQVSKARLMGLEPSVASQNYYPVPEDLRRTYSSASTGFNNQNNVASPVPVERHSYTKYNITTQVPQSIVESRRVFPVSSSQQVDMSLIEGVYSEGKIKYEADGDLLVSDTQQTLKLVTCVPTRELARLAPELSTLINDEPSKPTQQYDTIQCELSTQKLKFYQAVSKYAQLQQSLKQGSGFTTQGQQQMPTTSALYSHKMILPFALSASWYPIVATGEETAERSIEHHLDPEQLAKSYEHLLVSLAEDVIVEDVAQSKKAGEKIVRLVNIVAFMPKYKLAEIHDRLVERIQQAKQQQQRVNGKQAVVDNDEVSKWKVARKLFIDSLPLAGSKQAIEMIEILIQTQRVKSWEAKEMCEAVPANLRYPDTEIIDAFIRISQLPQVRKSRPLFASCSIAVGKMISSAYAKSQDASYRPTTYDSAQRLPSQLRDNEIVKQQVEEADPRRTTSSPSMSQQEQELFERLIVDEQDLTKYVKLYKQLLTKATQYHEKVVYIETLAHMKHPQVLAILEPFVTGRLSLGQCLGNQPLDINRPIEQSQWYNYYGKQRFAFKQQQQQEQKDWSEEDSYSAEECNYMRTIAIYALAHVSRDAPNKLQAILLPVFDNTYEPYQIRIAAFTTMMLTPVEEHILERIASQMWREPNHEVASFVVGTIDTMSKMNGPAMSPFKQAAQKAAESMPKQYLDTFKYSWMAGGDHFNQQKQTGLAWVAELIKSNVSSIPRAGYYHLGRYHGQSGSKYDNQIELGFTTKGLESLFRDYLAYNQQSNTETNLVASIFENLYDAKDDLANYYREARDQVKQSILMPEEQQQKDSTTQNFFFKRQQPIEGVNSQQQKQSRQASNLFEGSWRQKRSITIQARNQQAQQDADEEAKLTVFSKLFDSTSYHAMDKKQIIAMLEKSDDYLKMVADELIMGGKLHYVKMMMPNNMWHMVPSQMGLPVVVTHREPIVASLKIDGSQNGQLTSSRVSQFIRQQVTQGTQVPKVQGQNFATMTGLNLTALVHPKIIHSNFRFMFAVEQAQCEAYGVQVEKSHQLSVPMELSVAYSQAKQSVSVALEPKTPARMLWTKEAAKTYIGQVALATSQADNWLGEERLVRVPSQQTQYKRLHRAEQVLPSLLAGVQSFIQEPKESQRLTIEELETPYKFEHRFVQQLLGLELYLEGATDDEDLVRSMNKPELSKESRGYLQWSQTEQVDELDQHSKSGPYADFLHMLDSALTRPSKYLEFYSTLKPNQPHKSPVYRFDFLLNQKQQQDKKQQFRQSADRSQIFGRSEVQQQQQPKMWQDIEQSRRMTKQMQQPIMFD